MERFRGRITAVTGAASGLGRAIALGPATEGARLLLLDRDGAALAADVSNAAAAAAAQTEGLARLGPASLMTAAGILGPTVPALEAEEADWDHVFAVNVKGT